MPEQASEGSNSGSGDAAFFIAYNVRTNMATKRTAQNGNKPAPAPAQTAQVQQEEANVSLKRCHRSTHEILTKLRQVMTDFFAIDDLLSYDVDTITFEDEVTLRISGEHARLDVRLVSLYQEGGEE
ncbi:hypothetical protein [Porphyromonas phage phage019b_ATCC49417]|nr:hypothetical protein PGIN_ATCC49417_01703 [Porphyromonas gingivalis]